MNLNKVLLGGNLTRDPELTFTPKGTAICKCGLAVNRRWRGEDGQDKEEVTFIDVTFWGKTAETVAEHMAKGRPIFIEGRLKLDTWDDKETGQKRYKLHVVAESFQFVGSKPKDEPEGRSQRGGTESRRKPTPQAAAAHEDATGHGGSDNDDDVPF